MANIQTVTAPSGVIASVAGTTSYASGSELTYIFGSSSDEFYGLDAAALFGSSTQTDFIFQDEAEIAFAAANLVADVSFTEVSTQTDADLSFYGGDSLSFYGAQTTPTSLFGIDSSGSYTEVEADIVSHVGIGFFDTTDADMLTEPADAGDGNMRTYTLLHEIGHSLGLGHTHDDSNGSLFDIAGTDLDDGKYSVMSYETLLNYGVVSFGHPVSFMALDIAALQHLYGVNETAYTTATTYTLEDFSTAVLDVDGSDGGVSVGDAYYCVWDAGGDDAITYSGSYDSIINLNDATLETSLGTDEQDLIDLLTEVEGSGAWDVLSSSVQDDLTNETKTAGGFFSQIMYDGYTASGGYSIANGAVIENANGGSGADVLIGNEAENTLNSGAGDDWLFGGSGDDILYGQDGDDELSGGSGADKIYGQGDDDILHGGDDNDTVNGGSGADTLYGDGGDDILYGEDDADTLYGGSGGDTLVGQNGDDILYGQSGDDQLSGGSGADKLYGQGDDDVLRGGADNDTVNGGSGADTLYGDGGDDILYGEDDNDTLYGESGSDTLYGQSGTDVLDGGKGNDTLKGGGDTDSFVFAADFGNDTIVDFENGVELVDISATGFSSSDLNVTTSGSDAVVDFGGSDTITFTGLAGSIDVSDFLF